MTSQANETEYPITNKEYPMKNGRTFDLQDRFIDFAVLFKSVETAKKNKERI